MVGKQLSALLQILRSNGVRRYQTAQLTLELGAPPAPRAPRVVNLSPEALDADPEAHGGGDPDEEDGDPRFLLERLTPKHFPRQVADPRKNKGAS